MNYERETQNKRPASPSCTSCCPIPPPQTRSTEPDTSWADLDVWWCRRNYRTWSACRTVHGNPSASWWTRELYLYASPAGTRTHRNMHSNADTWQNTHQNVFITSSRKLGRFYEKMVHSVLNKCAANWLKHFPPHLNSISTLPWEN